MAVIYTEYTLLKQTFIVVYIYGDVSNQNATIIFIYASLFYCKVILTLINDVLV